MSQVHPLARTTPRTRTEIKASSAPLTVLAERYNLTEATARKWKNREDAQDRSHRPHNLSTTLHLSSPGCLSTRLTNNSGFSLRHFCSA